MRRLKPRMQPLKGSAVLRIRDQRREVEGKARRLRLMFNRRCDATLRFYLDDFLR